MLDRCHDEEQGIKTEVFPVLTRTTMTNPYLPPEMLDYIVDLLHDEPETLKRCCLTSKSWIPRTRKHIFADMEFYYREDVRSWNETFPDPANSPACYAKTLYIGPRVSATDPEVGGWIRGFSRVERLEMHNQGLFIDRSASFAPLHGFLPSVKSFRIAFAALPRPWLFNLIFSFPLIEDLDVTALAEAGNYNGSGGETPIATQPSIPPMFTGSLELWMKAGMEPFAGRLLSLPGGIHFRKLTLTWLHDKDLSTTMALVEGCSHTLEFLDITWGLLGKSIRHLCPHR